MFARTSRSNAARIVLALMLFAQGAMAWSACQLPERAPELALRAAAEHEGCEQMTASNSAESAVCFTHSLAEKQSLYKPALDIPSATVAAIQFVLPPVDWQVIAESVPQSIRIAGTGPPRRILLQSFQI